MGYCGQRDEIVGVIRGHFLLSCVVLYCVVLCLCCVVLCCVMLCCVVIMSCRGREGY